MANMKRLIGENDIEEMKVLNQEYMEEFLLLDKMADDILRDWEELKKATDELKSTIDKHLGTIKARHIGRV